VFPSTLSLLLLLSATAAYQPRVVVPNFRSLTIRTRITTGDWASSEETLYLQGARQRTDTDSLVEPPGQPSSFARSALIVQCDQRTRIILDLVHRTYDEGPILGGSAALQKAGTAPPAGTGSGGDVTVTIDSVDTGERRWLGSLTARHVKLRLQVDSGPGAHTPSSRQERDGWYVDLPELSCRGSHGFAVGWIHPGDASDNFHFRRLGTAVTGYPIEETSRKLENGRVLTTKTEFLNLCENRLDSSLFEKPAGFQPALHSALGVDFTKPDTWSNRLEAYLTYLRWKTANLFR
jgi:hypothetical protein